MNTFNKLLFAVFVIMYFAVVSCKNSKRQLVCNSNKYKLINDIEKYYIKYSAEHYISFSEFNRNNKLYYVSCSDSAKETLTFIIVKKVYENEYLDSVYVFSKDIIYIYVHDTMANGNDILTKNVIEYKKNFCSSLTHFMKYCKNGLFDENEIHNYLLSTGDLNPNDLFFLLWKSEYIYYMFTHMNKNVLYERRIKKIHPFYLRDSVVCDYPPR